MKKILVNHLLDRIAQGDVNAFEELYDQMFLIICSLAYSIIPDYQLAEDIAQETFINVGSHIKEYRQPENGFSWVYTIAKNIALNNYNKKKKEMNTDNPYLQNNIDTIENSFENQIEERELIHVLLSGISDIDRQIIVLHLMSGMKHKEIAQMLDLPLGTVLSKYNRSIKKLKSIREVANE